MNKLNILIIEDNYEKVRVIADAIKDNDACNLEYCNNTRESLSMLQNKKYNIVLVDMILPKCIGDHCEPDAGIELIERLYSDKRLYSPDEIIAVTSHKDAFIKQERRLFDLGVPFVLADDSFEKIKLILLNKIKYCLNLKHSSSMTQEKVDEVTLSLPEKVTLKWIYNSVGLDFWLKVISIFLGIYILGIQSSKLTVVKQVFNLEKKEETAIKKEVKSTLENTSSKLSDK